MAKDLKAQIEIAADASGDVVAVLGDRHALGVGRIDPAARDLHAIARRELVEPLPGLAVGQQHPVVDRAAELDAAPRAHGHRLVVADHVSDGKSETSHDDNVPGHRLAKRGGFA